MRVEQATEYEELAEELIDTTRVRKTVAGGQIPSIRAVVAVGDGKGMVGLGIGKARQHPDAIRKATERARKNMVLIPLKGTTIPHEVHGKCGGVSVMIKPASQGTGLVAGVGVRELLEVAGISDVLSKSQGARNRLNRAAAAFAALRKLRSPDQVRQILAAQAEPAEAKSSEAAERKSPEPQAAKPTPPQPEAAAQEPNPLRGSEAAE
jgi:small subunit ribosomal protein S5